MHSGEAPVQGSPRQMWVVSHAGRLIAALQQDPECNSIVLEKNFGQTEIVGQGMLDEPVWHWPD